MNGKAVRTISIVMVGLGGFLIGSGVTGIREKLKANRILMEIQTKLTEVALTTASRQIDENLKLKKELEEKKVEGEA